MTIRLMVASTVSILAWVSWAPVQGGTPIPTYGTYFGGGGQESAVAVATDGQSNVIVVGTTTSQSLPGTANALQSTHAAGFPSNIDVFVAKFDPTGRRLLWATFLGGDADDIPVALGVDADGNIYVTGTTGSSNFPVNSSISCVPSSGADFSTPFQQRCSMSSTASGANGFVSKISQDGHSLLYSIGLGNPQDGSLQPTALTVDAQGRAYVGAVGPGGFEGLFLFRLEAAGTQLDYGLFLGGGDIAFLARITALASDDQGNCYVGGTATINVPTTPNALQTSNPNADLSPNLGNGFIIKVDSIGSGLLYGTWLGSRYYATTVSGIALNLGGSLLLAGTTNAPTFTATPGAYMSTPGGGFIANLVIGSTTLSAFSYLPFTSPLSCGIGSGGGIFSCGNVSLVSGKQNAYVLFRANGFGGPEILHLSLPALANGSPTPSFSVIGADVANIYLSSDSSVWAVGGCLSCSLGNLISSDAYESTPTGAGDAVLIQLTEVAPSIASAASSATGISTFSAGQLISIYGSQLGPSQGSSAQIGPDYTITKSNGGTQVLFDGVAAPILYTGANQVNTAIPCSVAGHSSTQMVVQYLGAQSAPMTVQLNTAAPGIFTINGSGSGQGAVLNQDYSLNGPLNPAPRGSVAILYGTGIGPTSPCVDGQIYASNFPKETLPVDVGVGDIGAQVLYAGQAPYLVSGAAQINFVIPSYVSPGTVPLTLEVGGIFSPSGVTIAVK